MGGGQCEVEDGLARATRQPPDDRRDSIGHERRNNCGSSGEYGDRRFGLNDGDQNGRGLVVSGGGESPLHGDTGSSSEGEFSSYLPIGIPGAIYVVGITHIHGYLPLSDGLRRIGR